MLTSNSAGYFDQEGDDSDEEGGDLSDGLDEAQPQKKKRKRRKNKKKKRKGATNQEVTATTTGTTISIPGMMENNEMIASAEKGAENGDTD